MEPQIQYCKTSDGVSIAYYAVGDGPTLIITSNTNNSHLLLQRRTPGFRRYIDALERRHRVVRYDGRGSGLSERESPDFSLAARRLDLEAVVDRLRLERFALIGSFTGGLAAVAYAVRRPERLTHLVLDNAYACGRDYWQGSPARRARAAMRPTTNEDWEFYALSAAQWDSQLSDSDEAKERADLTRASMAPSAMLAFRDATLEIDVTDLLPQVRSPTLVLCRPSQSSDQPKLSQVLASRIPDARLAVLGPRTGSGVDEESLRAVEEFLGDGAVAEEPGSSLVEAALPRETTSAFRTILFTDIVGHTPMMQRLGDDAGRAVLREHERITREVLKQHGGTEVKTDGDSFMASFTSATKAVECAVSLQRAFAAHNSASEEPILIRAGLNVGEPIEEDGDYFGSAVILGDRIKDQAAAGEILVPEAVRYMLSGKDILFSDRGEVTLKGFEDPVRVYEVRWRQ